MNIFTLNTTISEKVENFWSHRQRPLIHIAIVSCYIISGIVNAVQGLIVLEGDWWTFSEIGRDCYDFAGVSSYW